MLFVANGRRRSDKNISLFGAGNCQVNIFTVDCRFLRMDVCHLPGAAIPVVKLAQCSFHPSFKKLHL